MNWRNIAMTDEKKIIKEAIDDIKPGVYENQTSSEN